MDGIGRTSSSGTDDAKGSMANKRRAHDEEAWRNAKKICRLASGGRVHRRALLEAVRRRFGPSPACTEAGLSQAFDPTTGRAPLPVFICASILAGFASESLGCGVLPQ